MSEKKLLSSFYVHQPKHLDKFLVESLEISRKEAKRLLDSRMVFVNDVRVWIAGFQLKKGDLVSVSVQKERSKDISEKDILFVDKYYVVLNKPSGIVSNGEKSIELALQRYLKDKNVRAVHRLDKDTTGCLLFARSKEAWDKIVEAFEDVKKRYITFVSGRFQQKELKVTVPIDGKSAESIFTLKSHRKGFSELSVDLKTGRTHQIRKHLFHHKYSILGDKVYSSDKKTKDENKMIKRQLLHAEKITFKHPYSGNIISTTAPMPDDMKMLLS